MIVFAIAKDYVWQGRTTCQLKVGGGDMFGLLHREFPGVSGAILVCTNKLLLSSQYVKLLSIGFVQVT